MREFVIITKPNCPYCDQAKALIELRGDIYTEMVLDEDILLAEVQSRFPKIKTVPIIIKSRTKDELIGGYKQLREFYDRLS